MSTVAEQLHQAREARKLTIQEIAEITKIRSDHLRALEEGNFNMFSAPVYIRGFVRTYSTLLKLDVPKVMGALDEELGQTKKFAEPPPLSDSPRGPMDFVMLQLSRLSWRRGWLAVTAGVLLVAIAAGYVTWRHYRGADPLRGLKPGMYQPAQNVSGASLPVPTPQPKR